MSQIGNNVAQSFQQQQQYNRQQFQNNAYQNQQQQQYPSSTNMYSQYGSGYSSYNPYSSLPLTYQQNLQNNMNNYNSSLNTQSNSMSGGLNTQTHQSIVWVQGEAGAKAYPVSSGNTVMLMDSEDNVFYLKTTDINGIPLPLRIYDYVERGKDKSDVNSIDNNILNIKNVVDNTDNSFNLEEQFVTRNEFKKLINDLDNLKEQWGKKNESNIQHVERQQGNKQSAKQQHGKYNATIQPVQE